MIAAALGADPSEDSKTEGLDMVADSDRPTVVFFGRKPGGTLALEYLHQQLCWDVRAVVTPAAPEPGWLNPRPLAVYARSLGIPVFSQASLLEAIEDPEGEVGAVIGRVDWVISYLYPYRIRDAVLAYPRKGAINFHPGPLPRHGGVGGYNMAIIEQDREYGATCHFMVSQFDAGPIVECRLFPIDAEVETALSLELQTQHHMLRLFHSVCRRVHRDGELQATQQEGLRYVARGEVDALREITCDLAPEEADRRARGFWYPPYDGAHVTVAGRKLTVVPRCVLQGLGPLVHATDLDSLSRAVRDLA